MSFPTSSPFFLPPTNRPLALITISTRASLKKYHTFNLTLNPDGAAQWEFQRIGTETEKLHARRELEVLRERLAQVDKWKRRHAEIEAELARVWVEGSEEAVEAPGYVAASEKGEGEVVVEQEEVEVARTETEAEETADEADYQEAQEQIGDETETETEADTTFTAGEGSGVVV